MTITMAFGVLFNNVSSTFITVSDGIWPLQHQMALAIVHKLSKEDDSIISNIAECALCVTDCV